MHSIDAADAKAGPALTHLQPNGLVSLTGYEQPKRMCSWLADRSWVFERLERCGDIPKVSRAYHDARMSGVQPTKQCVGPRLAFMTEPA